MNKKKLLLKAILLLGGAIPLLIILFYGVVFFQLYIALEHPALIYKGDKTVPKEDVIYLEKLKIRDLHLDQYRNYGECTRHFKYYIVKKNFLSRKRLYKQLSQYCVDYYKNLNIYDYDEVRFFFYEESSTMPWFWNNDGFFPDLQSNSGCLICKCFVSKDGIKLIEGG